MKIKSAILAIALVTTSITSFAYDFRKADWGMSLKDVKASEKEKVHSQEDTYVIYKTSVAGLDTMFAYYFTESGKFYRAMYIFTESHTNKNKFINDYDSIVKLLTEKYGAPKTSESYWNNDLYQGDYSKKGFAVSLGHHSRHDIWDIGTATIYASLTGDNYEISHQVIYESEALTDEAASERKEKRNNEL